MAVVQRLLVSRQGCHLLLLHCIIIDWRGRFPEGLNVADRWLIRLTNHRLERRLIHPLLGFLISEALLQVWLGERLVLSRDHHYFNRLLLMLDCLHERRVDGAAWVLGLHSGWSYGISRVVLIVSRDFSLLQNSIVLMTIFWVSSFWWVFEGHFRLEDCQSGPLDERGCIVCKLIDGATVPVVTSKVWIGL